MKLLFRILAVLALLLIIGIAIVVWVSFQIRNHHQDHFSKKSS
ncbi:hypothetical protein N8766_05370 [bacterium]|nr:hypothetical protein [bacterium]